MDNNTIVKAKKLLLTVRLLSFFSIIFLIARFVYNFIYQYGINFFLYPAFSISYGFSITSVISAVLVLFYIQKSKLEQNDKELIALGLVGFAVSFVIPIHHLALGSGFTVFYILFNVSALSSSFVLAFKTFKKDYSQALYRNTFIYNIVSAVFSFITLSIRMRSYNFLIAFLLCLFSFLAGVCFHTAIFIRGYFSDKFQFIPPRKQAQPNSAEKEAK